MENKNNNGLTIFLIIIIMALCATVGFLLIYNKLDKNEENNNQIQNNSDSLKEKDISDSQIAKDVIEKFMISTYEREITTYMYERVENKELLNIAYINSEDLIKEESNCDGRFYGDSRYTCKYIQREDLNKNYKLLTGQSLAYSDIYISKFLLDLVYDVFEDIYRICNVPAGGGPGPLYLSKVDKVTTKDDYLYVYEKVSFIIDDIDSGDNVPMYLKKPHLFDENYNYNGEDILVGTTGQINPYIEDGKNKIIEENIDKFDTYKWTFRKDSNGNYIFRNLQYVIE